mgnify:FL=1
MKHYWTVIDSLMFYIEHGYDREYLKNALLQLDIELDRREVYNLPSDEIKTLRDVLNRVIARGAENE